MKSNRAYDPYRIAPNKDTAHPFDLRYGLDTGGYLSPRELETGHLHDVFCYGYSAIAPSVFDAAIQRWRGTLRGTAAQIGAYSFVDVGSGKGRALLLASQLAFRKVIGVELSVVLASIAKRNAASWRKVGRPRAAIRVFQQDALEFRWPRTPLLVFLYNPFQCYMVEKLLTCIEERGTGSAHPGARLVDVLYINPVCAETFSRRRTFSLLWTDRIDMSESDQSADPYGTTFDRVSCYRLRRQG